MLESGEGIMPPPRGSRRQGWNPEGGVDPVKPPSGVTTSLRIPLGLSITGTKLTQYGKGAFSTHAMKPRPAIIGVLAVTILVVAVLLSSKGNMGFLDRILGRSGGSQNVPAALQKHRPFLDSLRKPAVHLVASPQRGFSQVGGKPTLPAGFEWPAWNGKPLNFLCQIDLKAIPADADIGPLPRIGYLFFFFSAEQETWGFDPKDIGSWRVFYFEKLENAAEASCPPTLPKQHVYDAVHVMFKSVLTYPDSEDERVDRLQLSDAEREAYLDLGHSVFEGKPAHHLLGHPGPVQNNDMDLECQLVSHGVYCGDESGYKSPRRAELEKGKADWLLLLQLDSDDDADMMWGDAGRLYFWINKNDLVRRDFSKVWMILQCY